MSQDIVRVSAMGTVKGIEAFTGFVAGFMQVFPDQRFDTRTLVEDLETVIAEDLFVGTNIGPMITPAGAMPAINRKVELAFYDVIEVNDGRITENRIYYDQLSLLDQLALMPAGK